MWSKSNVFSKFQIYKTFVKTQIGRKIKILNLDNGGEYRCLKFNKFCDECNIQHQIFISYTPQKMGLLKKKLHIDGIHLKYIPIMQVAQFILGWSNFYNDLSPKKFILIFFEWNMTPYDIWIGFKCDFFSMGV